MSRRQQISLAALIAAVAVLALLWGIIYGTDVTASILSAAVLLVALLTLFIVAPRSAELWVERQGELGLDDLIFYIYPQPPRPGVEQVPRDFLLQLHVAVVNVGGRKAVLSALHLHRFLDAAGVEVRLPEIPIPLAAARVSQQSGWIDHQRHFQLLQVLPPYILEPDDVITLRFRCRRGIDWSDRWGLTELRAFGEAVARDIATADLTATFRRGTAVEHKQFLVPIHVVQQREFRELLHSLTQDFTVRPQIPEQGVDIE